MSLSEVRLITVSCDMPWCENTIACGGDEEFAEKNGWREHQVILERQFDHLCPDCVQELVDFVAGETDDHEGREVPDDDPADAPVMDLKAVLADEQPRDDDEPLTPKVPKAPVISPETVGEFDD